ncbi:FecR domain-containing protein [Mucilaginibacter sabulilitoris]|uniref:FecR domain-containing protein n=1 Tax=Mucilaginibacter sabulilitoris TaxID=1173583 RepID=A0ABZ0TJ64_9SPHI|nr:FecR domain-containing protein [Mucilaginibacter sabulilitoris]WPU91610.1 FecR domain-containing protein [Mucilaginibacter sabulilitoris]
MNQQQADQLIEKYLNGSASADERHLIENWYASQSEKRLLSDTDDFEHLYAELLKKTLIKANIKPRKGIIRLWPVIAAAASIVLAVTISIYFYKKELPDLTASAPHRKAPVRDVSPGSNKAMLTLASGQRIMLTGAQNGRLASDNNVVIDKTADGQLRYQGGSANSEKVNYNTMTTPRGGQYNVILADGTKVFLNAESSITFPTDFKGNDRTVRLEGEAYFEVAHNPLKPFRVISNHQTIEVLGTHFNVHSYPDERLIKTTLLEGSVKIISGAKTTMLKPGQQAQLDASSTQLGINISEVNTEEAVAWKNGLFEFNNSSIEDVMQSAARWYDLDVSYADHPSDIKITGSMSRNVNLSGLINLLEFEGAKFRINGKSVKVLN